MGGMGWVSECVSERSVGWEGSGGVVGRNEGG